MQVLPKNVHNIILTITDTIDPGLEITEFPTRVPLSIPERDDLQVEVNLNGHLLVNPAKRARKDVIVPILAYSKSNRALEDAIRKCSNNSYLGGVTLKLYAFNKIITYVNGVLSNYTILPYVNENYKEDYHIYKFTFFDFSEEFNF